MLVKLIKTIMLFSRKTKLSNPMKVRCKLKVIGISESDVQGAVEWARM